MPMLFGVFERLRRRPGVSQTDGSHHCGEQNNSCIHQWVRFLFYVEA
jgi:hypothetical protein